MSLAQDQARVRFLATLEIARRELVFLDYSRGRIFSATINADWVERLSNDMPAAEILAAFVSRFGRFQDTVGDKLLPRALIALLERPRSLLDNLSRAEQLGWIEDAEAWVTARELRNRLIHEYMMDVGRFAEDIHAARVALSKCSGGATGVFLPLPRNALGCWSRSCNGISDEVRSRTPGNHSAKTPREMTTATEKKGWLRARKWLLLRRLSQFSVLGLFLIGPWFGVWVISGNLSASLLLDTIPFTDPHIFLQTLAAGHWRPAAELVMGVAILLLFYGLVGGRVFCAWVCPVNLITDAAAGLRRRLGLKGGANLSRSTRYWMLAATLLLAFVTGGLAWEMVNPVTIIHRGIIFGMGLGLGLGWLVVLGIFLFDLLIAKNGWCGHLCPTGAVYALIGKISLIRVRADGRDHCTDCMDCFMVCPEPKVITPALKGGEGSSPVIRSGACTNCGRCIDVCEEGVFWMGARRARQE